MTYLSSNSPPDANSVTIKTFVGATYVQIRPIKFSCLTCDKKADSDEVSSRYIPERVKTRHETSLLYLAENVYLPFETTARRHVLCLVDRLPHGRTKKLERYLREKIDSAILHLHRNNIFGELINGSVHRRKTTDTYLFSELKTLKELVGVPTEGHLVCHSAACSPHCELTSPRQPSFEYRARLKPLPKQIS